MSRTPSKLLLAATATTMLALLGTAIAAPAQADQAASVERRQANVVSEADDSRCIYEYAGSTLVGSGCFHADPEGSVPGDAIRACDWYADGYGYEVQLDVSPTGIWDVDRRVNTRGHDSPYCSPWATGNIAEGTPVAIKLCRVRGTYESCGPAVHTRA